jgi:hypothetical protein
MFTGKLCGLNTPDQGSANTLDLICSDLLTIARATQDDAECGWILCHSLRRWNAEIWVIIEGIKFIWAMIGDIVAMCDEMMNELVLKLKTSMIATDVNAHGQFKHGKSMEKGKPAKRWGCLAGFLP